jgi:hypothetical protein
VCGEWEKLECDACGYKSGAKPFYDAGCKCPKCGAKMAVSGAEFNIWIVIAAVAAVAAIGLAIYLYSRS